MTPAFTRTVRFTPVLNYVTIKWDGKLLSITGNCHGRGYGQCYDSILAKYPRPTVRLLVAFWKAWHLNDTNAGLPIQTAFLEANPSITTFSAACEALKAAGLYEIDGYQYGQSWLSAPVPDYVLEWLRDAKI